MITRRRFLELAGYGGAALCWACNPTSVTTTALGGTTTVTTAVGGRTTTLGPLTGDLPTAVWREVLAALRTSPDHLAAQAEALVATGDPEAIFAFVRDQIVTYPPRTNSMAAADTETRWGIRGTLRGGAGTPREKADLLADLYQRAGLETEVVAGAPVASFDVKAMLSSRPEREFAPVVDTAIISRWHGALKIGATEPIRRLDADGSIAGEIVGQIVSVLPSGLAAPGFDFTPPSNIPFVRVVVAGEERFANPLLPDAVFGESYVERVSRASAALASGQIEVGILVTSTNNPSIRTEVATGRWPVEDVVGRRISARFLPAGDPLASLVASAEVVGTFTPVLTLDALDLDHDQLAERAVVGDSVAVGGDVLAIDQEGKLTMNGEPFEADPPSASNVASLTPTVNAAGFPTVRVTALAADASGQPVLGVPAEAFTLEENGVPLPFLLRQTRPPRPKVLLLLDTSSSIPAEFLGAQAAALARDVATDVLSTYPEAQFRTAGVLAGRAAASRAWTSDPVQVEAEATDVIGHGSEIWSATADVRFVGANVVVLITDGQSTDTPEQIAAARNFIGSGPPVICLGVGETDMATLEDIASLSGGAAFPVTAQAEAIAAITSFLDLRVKTPLLFEYQAPGEGGDVRSLRIAAAGVTTTVEYEVPPPVERIPPPALAGIYLRVRYKTKELLRTIAGIPHEVAAKASVATPEQREEVRSALFGVATITVEAAAPTFAAWLDDFFTAKLTLQPLVDAMGSGDGFATLEALSVARNVPTSSLALHPALAGGENLTFETGPRFVLLTSRPVFGVGLLRRSDVLNLTGFATAAADPVVAFTNTVERTAKLAATEAELFQDNTFARLTGQRLAYLAPRKGLPISGPLEPFARALNSYSGYHRLHPENPDGFAAWGVDEQGTVIGLLPDGSGGGSSLEDIAAECKKTGRKAAVLQLIDPGFGLPYAAVVSLQKAISTQILRYAAIVSTIENPQVPEECGGFEQLPCDLLKDGLSEFSEAYKLIDTADDIAEAGTGDGLINC